jgi:uncharacterized repeat protein (TIGR04138 family)
MELAELERWVEDSPYELEAYEFVLRALDFTIQGFDEVRHVSGQELVEGIRSYARAEFGPMAKHVLNHWGVHATRDFGEIVFLLVERGLLRKTEEDSLEDFDDGFDFEAVFEREYYSDLALEQDGAA